MELTRNEISTNSITSTNESKIEVTYDMTANINNNEIQSDQKDSKDLTTYNQCIVPIFGTSFIWYFLSIFGSFAGFIRYMLLSNTCKEYFNPLVGVLIGVISFVGLSIVITNIAFSCLHITTLQYLKIAVPITNTLMLIIFVCSIMILQIIGWHYNFSGNYDNYAISYPVTKHIPYCDDKLNSALTNISSMCILHFEVIIIIAVLEIFIILQQICKTCRC